MKTDIQVVMGWGQVEWKGVGRADDVALIAETFHAGRGPEVAIQMEYPDGESPAHGYFHADLILPAAQAIALGQQLIALAAQAESEISDAGKQV